jgi:hypothetical protein
MFKVLLTIQLLCHAPFGEAPACTVRWVTMPSGTQSVAITGFHKDAVVICRIRNAAMADCTAYRVDKPDATPRGEDAGMDRGVRLSFYSSRSNYS